MKNEMDLLAEARPDVLRPADVMDRGAQAALFAEIVEPAPAPGTRRRTMKRRRAAGWTVVPVAAAGIAVVAALLVSRPAGDRGSPTVSPTTGGVAAPATEGPAGAEVVLTRMETAVRGAGGLVKIEVIEGFVGCDSWIATRLDRDGEPVQDRMVETCGGRPSQDVGSEKDPDRSDHLIFTAVLHGERTWSRHSEYRSADGWPAVNGPEELRALLADGELTVVGHQRVNGRDTIHLRASSPNWPRSADPQYWVDASTYLLVKSVIWKGTNALRTSYQWARPTPQVLARLRVPIPAGYRHIDG